MARRAINIIAKSALTEAFHIEELRLRMITLEDFKKLTASNDCFERYRVEFLADDGVWDLDKTLPTFAEAHAWIVHEPILRQYQTRIVKELVFKQTIELKDVV